MKESRIVVPWTGGLHLRPAARLVKVAGSFRSTVILKCGDRIANLRSILSILALCAACGTPLSIEATGEDEQYAMETVEHVFSSGELGD